MSNRLVIGLLAVGFALSVSEACNHAAGNGSTGTAGTGSTGTGNGSGQAGTGSGTAGTSGAAGNVGTTGTAGTATGTGNGVTFWAKGSGTLRVEFAMRSFVPTDRGGSCTSNCWNVYGANTPTLTSNWTQITIMFAGMQREQGGTSPAFNPSELMSISFKGPGTFDFWIDEVA